MSDEMSLQATSSNTMGRYWTQSSLEDFPFHIIKNSPNTMSIVEAKNQKAAAKKTEAATTEEAAVVRAAAEEATTADATKN